MKCASKTGCLIGRLCVGMLLAALIGCAESSKTQEKKSTDNGKAAGTNSSDDLCQNLSRQQVATDANYSDFVTQLCGGMLTTLRAPTKQYRGSGTPNIQPEAVQKGAQSQMRLWASMATEADAKSYFNLMRLQSFQPEQFKAQQFEYDQAIKYEILSQSGTNSISYHYTNRKEDLTVEYQATSTFVEAVPGKLYIITSRLDQSIGIVKTFRALQVIYQQTGYTEVFSMSDQLYDNNNNHETTVAKAQNEFIQDMARSFRNARSAQKANQFFIQ